MKIKEILKIVNHRPWKLPKSDWKFYQEWNNAIFLHWHVDKTELRKFVPKEIEIDLFNGEPWVSLVAFRMEKIRPKYLPSFPPISDFDEINIRTYVKYNGKPGVFFLSIEGGTDLSCKIAKGISELPYRYSKIKRTSNKYISENREFKDKFEIDYKIGNKLENKEEIDLWLTERYALFQNTDRAVNGFEIHHVEWPINHVELKNITVNYKRFNKLINNTPDKIAYSKGVEVIAWGKEKRFSLDLK